MRQKEFILSCGYQKGMMYTSFNDVNVTEKWNRKLLEQAKTFFTLFLPRILNTDLHVVIYLRNVLLFKTSFIISQILLFFASEEEKKSVSDGVERFILGLQFDKIAPNEYNSTKLTKILQSTLNPGKHAIRRISNYSPAKISNNNSYNLYECFDNHPIKITSGFWIVTSLNSVSAQLSDDSLGSLRLYKSI